MNTLSQISDLLNSKENALPINKKELEEALDTIFQQLLFPVCTGNYTCSTRPLHFVYSVLLENITNLMGREKAESIVDSFISGLPDLQTGLRKEAECYIHNDPAARSIEEVILAYPGFYALSVHRISHILFNSGVPIIPRLFSEHAHAKVGIDIHPGANIGNHFFIDHGTGIVIGETSIIGENVKIYQGVTLGALFVTKELKGTKRHPTIEDNVVIYAGATILGGSTVVGHDSTIGGNAWLTRSIVPYSVVFNNSEVRIKTAQDFGDADSFNYTI
ncbi:serine O-acetyltransferase EpsC [Dysgonomonas macrotermitis]|uniref:Serine O-acetyltransferase n=1 Tax=Dysgonomonas macrotermitis TaxID=1346286 RepID=A0A1M5DZ16_9BACT|nr:serine O-acetyltransferase EpsC [Dysgonomonas macrotermitis]SHF72237.1 serine O-acetyltransferase [Dysgonomonas macrotermitis]